MGLKPQTLRKPSWFSPQTSKFMKIELIFTPNFKKTELIFTSRPSRDWWLGLCWTMCPSLPVYKRGFIFFIPRSTNGGLDFSFQRLQKRFYIFHSKVKVCHLSNAMTATPLSVIASKTMPTVVRTELLMYSWLGWRWRFCFIKTMLPGWFNIHIHGAADVLLGRIR